jgi:hypothetical protein
MPTALAFNMSGLKPGPLTIAMELASAGREDGTGCRSGQATIGEHAMLSTDAVGNHLRAMRKTEHIAITGIHKNGNGSVSDVFAIRLPKALPPEASATMLAVAFHYRLPPLQRAVFLAHAEVAGHDGRTWDRCPTEQQLAERFGVTTGSIRLARRWLRGYQNSGAERTGPMLLYKQEGHSAPGHSVGFDVCFCRAGQALPDVYRNRQVASRRKAAQPTSEPVGGVFHPENSKLETEIALQREREAA